MSEVALTSACNYLSTWFFEKKKRETARYLEECLPRADYWDVPVAGQTEDAAPARILEFLQQASAHAV
jgi:hypothetical protein